MAKVREALSVALLASAVVGIQILTTDKYLWAAAPTHAYGLIAFVAFDVALVIALWRRTKLAVEGAILLASLQFAAMVGDIFAGQPPGVTADAFSSYLLNNTAFMALLTIQVILLALAVGATRVRSEYGMVRK